MAPRRKVAPPPSGCVWIEDYRSEDGTIVIPGIASRLGVSVSGYKKWRMRGEGPNAFPIGGKKIAARIADIEAWLRRRAEAAASENRASAEVDAHDSRPAEPRLANA